MKKASIWVMSIVFAASFVTFGIGDSYADAAEDRMWIKRCIADNVDEGQTQKTVVAYCRCMVDIMPEEEEQSVTAWEQSHQKEQEMCSRKAGWKGE